MYTLFTNEEKTNYYLVSKNSIEYHDYEVTKKIVFIGTKNECIAYMQENEIDIALTHD